MTEIIIVDTPSPELLVLRDHLIRQLHVSVTIVGSVEEAKAFPAPSALILAMKLSIDKYTPLEGVPTILITGKLSVQSRQFLLAKNLIDTVNDYSLHNCRYIVSLLQRIELLRDTKVLVCEGEKLTQTLIARNLSTLGVEPVLASSLSEVRKVMSKNENVRMVMVSSHLGKDHGLEVVEELRLSYNKLDLPIVAVMDEGDDEELEVEYLRHGATDTVIKRLSTPVSMEQFRARVMQNLRQVVSFYEMSRMAERDFLTGAFNRRHFFEAGEGLFANFERGNIFLAVAMLDIDDFKKVNDAYGHPAGDMAIISLAEQLDHEVRKTDLVARFGGEEFCVILSGTDQDQAVAVMERIRKALEEKIHVCESGEEFSITVSIGITVKREETLEDMVKEADRLLYTAKASGKNCVISNASPKK